MNDICLNCGEPCVAHFCSRECYDDWHEMMEEVEEFEKRKEDC